ncbi:MAG: pilin [Candidatus Peregrinibacteria bacterium]
MVKAARFIIGIALLTSFFAPFVLAQGEATGQTAASGSNSSSTTVANAPDATSVSDCTSKPIGTNPIRNVTPKNCLYLEEPIGGRANYDLFVVTKCSDTAEEKGCVYELWNGSSIRPPARGPVQAILAFSPCDTVIENGRRRENCSLGQKESQGLTLFYNYLGLIYQYMSGIIVSVVVLFIIVGGIQMTASSGDQTKYDAGKTRITKAIVGMLIWFLASLILYTINPTFFAF